ncbi:MAG: hypothetical protein CMO80_02700 [Verrucomicrobiales bacterium]|nr:hypothetical protein [Verrucomicrobiales bacterium]
MLQAGALGLLGLGTNHLSMLQAASGEVASVAPRARAKSVIYIFLSGGLAQHDTFDMKPDAPLEIRGEFKSIATKTPGLRVCEHMPMLAQRSNLWSICRSLTHKWNEHSQGHHIMLTGRSDIPAGFDARKPKETDHPSIAAIANHVLQSRNNLPPTIVLPERLVHRTGRVIPGQFAGYMGPRREPYFVEASRFNATTYGAYPEYEFHHGRGSQRTSIEFDAPSFTLPENLDFRRVKSRLGLTKQLDAQQSHLESAAGSQQMDSYRQMAVSLLSDPKVKGAFEIKDADPKLMERYGNNTFGWSCLMARQLVEAGVGLVQVNLGNNETWDTHQAAFPNLKNFLLPPMDRAVATLLDDLHERGLLEDTLVVMAGEFGRTPKIFKIPSATLPGRDHWGPVQTVFFAGGGVGGGRVIGASDNMGAYPDDDPQTPENLAATIYEALGIPRTMTWYDPVQRPFHVYHGEPIKGLFS